MIRTSTALFLATVCLPLAAQWTDVNDPPLGSVRGMHFFDALTGVLCGSGSIERTTDGGATWQAVATFSQDANDLDFTADGVHGICGLDDGLVLVSHDAGLTWTSFAVDGSTEAAWEVDIANGQTLFADMLSDPAFFSTDGGENWQPYTVVSNFQEMCFLDETNGFYCSLSAVFRTEDGGLSWTELADGFPSNLKGVVFTDALNGWVAGYDGYIAHTTNGGLDWTQQFINDEDISVLYCIDVDAGGLGVAGGSSTTGDEPVVFTTDGTNWSMAPFSPLTSSWSCSVPTPQVAYVCSHDGDLWRYGPAVGFEEQGASGMEVYPVPATDRVRVSVPAVGTNAWSMDLLDMAGRCLRTRAITSSSVELLREGLASGIYSLRLREGARTIAVRTVVFE